MNPFTDFVAAFNGALEQGRRIPLGQAPCPAHPPLPTQAPKILIFSPHPDDEVIIGGLALRFLREKGRRVVNVAVTQGSNPARQAGRLAELRQCCAHVGFDLVQTLENGLEGINLKTRQHHPQTWAASVARIVEILRDQAPQMIFFPHDRDWNSTHIGTHHLVVDALHQMTPDFACLTVETEFWGPMDDPNLMVEINATDLADLLTALTFHVGEVQRNPYHLRLPAWMIDNVRRGGELVGGQGGAAPDFAFATLYRLRRWQNGQLKRYFEGGRFVSATADLAEILHGA